MAALLSRSLRSGLFGHHWPLFSAVVPSRHSTTSRSRSLYQLVEDVERLEYYRAGGYHPIQIGHRLHERYRIVHKLGYGSFSTIWLVQDEQLSKYVAVKICTTDAIQHEVDTLSRLSAAAAAATATATRTSPRGLIPTVLDRFTIQGPNGIHPCLVTEPARCSLADTKEASVSRLFRLDVARSLAAQLALAVAHIHDQGLVHGGKYLHFQYTITQTLTMLPQTSTWVTSSSNYPPISTPSQKHNCTTSTAHPSLSQYFE